ncbi:MAG: FliM/FliN family flagellar motor switch protein [Planctomycetota bacterium]
MSNPTALPTASTATSTRPRFKCLPAYSRSLLKIRLPVTVTLATSRTSVGRVLELVPGSILQFKKTCDETLSLEVNGYRVAEGETVKVGDKFGLRITSMVLPEERFGPVKGTGKGHHSDRDDTGEPAGSESQ